MKTYRNLQQGTKEWFEMKLGKITGTVLADILGTPKAREGCLAEILSERLTPEVDVEHMHENAMARGTRLEPEALAAFEYVTGKQVERVGYCESDDNPWIGYSPDGIIGDTEDVEIKCPEGKNYMKIVLSNEVPKEYKHQIIQGFVVNPRLQTRYFVAYNPDIVKYPIHIIPVHRDSVKYEIESAIMAQLEFLGEVENTLQTLNIT